MRRLRTLNSFGRIGIGGQPWGWRGGGGDAAGGVCPVGDTFTDVDGTLLLAHTPDVDILGGGWDGGGIITGDKARIGVGAPSISLIDSGMSDMVLEATLTKDAGGVRIASKIDNRSGAVTPALGATELNSAVPNDMRIVH